jgi:hypothetical protein
MQAIHEAQFLGEGESTGPQGRDGPTSRGPSTGDERVGMSDEMYNAVLGLPPPLHAVSRQRAGPDAEGGA